MTYTRSILPVCVLKIRLTAQLRPWQATSIHGGLGGHIRPEVSELLPDPARLTETEGPGDSFNTVSDYKNVYYITAFTGK